MTQTKIGQRCWLSCLICAIFLLSNSSLAQISSDSLFVEGEVAFWNQGVAILEARGVEARIDETGSFSFFLRASSTDLDVVRDYSDARDCLTSSNPNSRRTVSSFFDITRDGDVIAELYLQTPRFDFQVGQAYKEFHYYSEATTVSGRCEDNFDDGSSNIYIFPDLSMKQGWNVLTSVITEKSDSSETYTLRLDDGDADFRWEVEALEVGETYIGIGANINSADEGLLISELYAGGALEAGLMPGDVITHIDGEDARDMNVGAAVLRLRGHEGEAVVLHVVRQGNTIEFEIVRKTTGAP